MLQRVVDERHEAFDRDRPFESGVVDEGRWHTPDGVPVGELEVAVEAFSRTPGGDLIADPNLIEPDLAYDLPQRLLVLDGPLLDQSPVEIPEESKRF